MANAASNYALAIKEAEPKYTHIVQADGLPFDFQKEAHFALQIVKGSTALQECKPESIRDAIINAAGVGLSLNPAQKHCYLIPWKGRCELFVSYMGMEYMALEAGVIQWIRADEVYSEDEFNIWHDEQGSHYTHKPKYGKRGTLVGSYAAWRYANGDIGVEFMDTTELAKVKAASKAPNSPAWNTWKGEMHKKAVIKRSAKHWRKTPLLARQIAKVHELDHDATYQNKDESTPSTIEGVSVELIDLEQTEILSSAIDNQKLMDRILTAYNIKTLGDLPVTLFNEALDRITAFKDARDANKVKPKTRRKA